jgi:homospermidine synthase
MKVKFNGKILVIGCGFVSRCTLPLLLKHFDMLPQKITVMDFEDFRPAVKVILDKGVKYVVDRITR